MPLLFALLLPGLLGQGTSTYPDGGKYEGEWEDGKQHGQGTYTYPNGSKYEGEWKDGRKHGQGTMTYPDGTVQRGTWKHGKLLALKQEQRVEQSEAAADP